MKTKILVLLAGFSLFGASFTAASDRLQAMLFPVSLFINGKQLESAGHPLLNYEGNAYVPLRYIVEAMRGKVQYEDRTKSIHVEYPSSQPLKSAISSFREQESFQLTLHSEKKIYEDNDPIQIWGSLRYTGEREIVIHRGDPLLLFSIKDGNGIQEEQGLNTVKIHESYAQYNEYTARMPYFLSESFNYRKSKIKQYSEFLQLTDQPWKLDAGEYTIGLRAIFTRASDDKRIEMYTEIPIKVN